MTQAAQKAANGQPLNKAERESLKLFKDMLVDIHKLRHGEKKVTITASAKDLQEQMFKDITPNQNANNTPNN